MKKVVLLPLVLLLFAAAFAQSRPKIDENLQKANKRPAQKAENQQKTEKETTETEETPTTANQSNEESSANAVTDGEVLRIDTNLVTIPVKISDRGNRFIAGLKKEDFKIFEDGKEQEIAYFSDAEEPFTVALVLDMSYSSTFKIGEIQIAAMDFINQLHPNDRVMVISFDEEVRVLCEPTNNREILQRAIKGTQTASGTSLYEAIDLVINNRLKKINGRKAVVLFTDGVDTTSRSAYAEENLRDAYETDALIYPVEYDTYNDVQRIKNNPTAAGGIPQGGGRQIPGTQTGTSNSIPFPFPGGSSTTIPGTNIPRTTGGGGFPGSGGGNKSPLPFPIPTTAGSQGTSAEDYRKAEEYLQELANSTGGRIYKASTASNLALAFTDIAKELRQIYSLGFYPADEKSGKRRQLKVRVNKDGAVVRARDSYVVGKKESKK